MSSRERLEGVSGRQDRAARARSPCSRASARALRGEPRGVGRDCQHSVTVEQRPQTVAFAKEERLGVPHAGSRGCAHLSMPPPSCTSSSARCRLPSSRNRPWISCSRPEPTISSWWRHGREGAGEDQRWDAQQAAVWPAMR